MIIYIHIAASTTLAHTPSFLSRHWKHADTAGGYYLKANTAGGYSLKANIVLLYICTRQRCAHQLGKFFVTLPSPINCSLKIFYMKYVVNHLPKAIETIVR